MNYKSRCDRLSQTSAIGLYLWGLTRYFMQKAADKHFFADILKSRLFRPIT
ncbi:hypothetical protein ALO83_103876 [Pseudomonas cannabina pv. alisalensis]|uniref:Uncharacterized protein n=1 Tax=Pseudomonas cannabina TaxID=86840 RepID=A0A3M3QC27_PSECA|nr:Unknown protein sequence [Pseudomonas syringae pv. maculicola]KPW24470.1 hypothetical protein ALO83_103876 [Pseudomonas cannabina pv. alisalensis]RMN78567.1 hypothetical protein ALQ52_104573 [Pseudomonas cannabina pv. alisalensis]RMN81689.1 hypothetical protein ALQ53_103609 [Pseudomonas cannabina]RMO00525.1 hypothetical protein ALQ51_102247 [Pseudomonas cannabina]